MVVLCLPAATNCRLLSVLVEAGCVVNLPEQGRFGLGYELRHLWASLYWPVEPTIGVTRLITCLHIEADAADYYAVRRREVGILAHVVDSKEHPRIAEIGFGFNDTWQDPGGRHDTA